MKVFTMIPDSLVNSASTSIAVNAAYYVFRGISDRNRDVSFLVGNTPDSKAALSLAVEAIKDIEKSEKIAIDKFPPDKMGTYLSELESFVSQRFSQGFKLDTSRGIELLNEMRTKKYE